MTRRTKPLPRPPWTPAEDQALRDAVAVGLDSKFWNVPLPGRRLGDILERRLELGLKGPPLL